VPVTFVQIGPVRHSFLFLCLFISKDIGAFIAIVIKVHVVSIGLLNKCMQISLVFSKRSCFYCSYLVFSLITVIGPGSSGGLYLIIL
jgi:hypothetical protein